MALTMPIAEQRRYPRVTCRLTGAVREMDSAGVSSTLGDFQRRASAVVLHNISLGGACIESDQSVEKDRIIRLEFSFPSRETLATFVEVCWAIGRKAGVRFLAVSEKGQVHLRQYILRETVTHSPRAVRGVPGN